MYKIVLEKQKLNFSAAHFITFEDECETLHGHNYYTTIEITGKPDENSYLMDFKIVKNEMKKICDQLDHKFLLATENRHLEIKQTGTHYEVIFKSKSYMFPKEDVIPIPIPNTTVEMLSKYLCEELKNALNERGYLANISSLEVGVEETAGQMASCRTDL
ncbi:MAG: 6-pyruvoyl tetrahydrobiopterin synthase [bacterium]|nr:MAG: 6-pyruvoyl tetrahydrobiopterin synthase [bacterium]